MQHIVEIVVFWAIVIVAIQLLAQFPDTWLARICFSHQGPLPIRGESRSNHLLRWCGYWASWLAQAIVVFGAGWIALSSDPSLENSTVFLVFWGVVVPFLGCVGLFGALFAFIASCWVRHVARQPPDAVHVNHG